MNNLNYDRQISNNIWEKVERKQELTKDESDYLLYCQLYEEYLNEVGDD